MEPSVNESRAKEIVAEIKQLVDAKGLNPDLISEETGISKEELDQFYSGKSVPNLTQFLALCEISGVTISLPFVETPKNPM